MEKNFYDIEQLVQFIFVENIDDHFIDMVIDKGVKNTKELFYTCVEILTAGLKLLYSDNEGKINLQTITLEQLEFVKKKMLLAKIDFRVDIIEKKDLIIEIDSDNNETISVTNKEDDVLVNHLITSLTDLDNNLKLFDYCFKIQLPTVIYFVRFNIMNKN